MKPERDIRKLFANLFYFLQKFDNKKHLGTITQIIRFVWGGPGGVTSLTGTVCTTVALTRKVSASGTRVSVVSVKVPTII
jgi:hypothetical protein